MFRSKPRRIILAAAAVALVLFALYGCNAPDAKGSLVVHCSNCSGLKAEVIRIYLYPDPSSDPCQYGSPLKKGRLSLQAGEYSINAADIIIESGKPGHFYSCRVNLDKNIRIEAGKQTKLRIGGPLKLSIGHIIGAPNQKSRIFRELKIGDFTIDNTIGKYVVKFYDNKGKCLKKTEASGYVARHGSGIECVPKLPIGRYKAEVICDLGPAIKPLVASTELKVRGFDLETYYDCCEGYESTINHLMIAETNEDPKKLNAAVSRARLKLLACFQKVAVQPGKAIKLADETHVSEGTFISPDKFSGTLKWYPESDALVVKAVVTDAFYSIYPDETRSEEASCLEVFVEPFEENCSPQRLARYFAFTPVGSGGNARVYSDYYEPYQGATATWRRTKNGYTIEGRIPWNSISSKKSGLRILPIQAQINTRTPEGKKALVMTPLGETGACETYAGLKISP